jgi:Transposase DDE domain group 1
MAAHPTDDELDLCESLASQMPEWCGRRPRHPLREVVRQRVYQTACGYEEQSDSDFLRTDPLLKLACGSLPETGVDLAPQPTICRMENVATSRACYRMARALLELYAPERDKDGAPEKMLLDLDVTADPIHGDQEESYYHGYLARHIYHPLLVFDGEKEHLIIAVLRPGNSHASRGTVVVLKPIAALLQTTWPAVEIEIRADAGIPHTGEGGALGRLGYEAFRGALLRLCARVSPRGGPVPMDAVLATGTYVDEVCV